MSKTSELFNECMASTPQDVKSINKIHSEEECSAALARIEELLPLTWKEELPMDGPNMQELVRLGNLVADWEDEHVVFSA